MTLRNYFNKVTDTIAALENLTKVSKATLQMLEADGLFPAVSYERDVKAAEDALAAWETFGTVDLDPPPVRVDLIRPGISG